MNNQFDELPNGLAQSVTHRAAPKKFGRRLAGMALACLGLANKPGARMNWTIPLLGAVLAGGSYTAAKTYLGYEQTIDSALAFHATLDRTEEAWRLLRIQTQLQDVGGTESATSLNGCLSDSVASLDRELVSPDEQTRYVVQGFFEYMARRQSQNPSLAASMPANPGSTGMGAHR
jgi:hypothetical protein